MEYKDLATLYHMDSSSDRESTLMKNLDDRRRSSSTFNIGFSTPAGDLFLAVPRELSTLNQKVLRRERKVSTLMKSLPGIAGNEVLRSLVIEEVVMSNSIENIHSTRKQIEDALETFSTDDVKFKRFREFAKLYLDLILGEYTVPESPEDIRHIYDKVMDGERLEYPLDGTLFRADEVIVADGLKQLHKGVLPESAIIQAMESMIDLVGSPEIPELYSALVSHYIFEYVHPFYDGNGRTGRYLLAMYLEAPLSKPTALSLSHVIAENKSQYYRAFQNVEDPLNHGEITFFVIAMHELILEAQDMLIARLEGNIATLDDISAKMTELESSNAFSKRELGILYALLQQRAFGVGPAMRLSFLAEQIEVGAQQTRKYLNGLEKRGIVKKVRGRDPVTFALTEDFLTEHGFNFEN